MKYILLVVVLALLLVGGAMFLSPSPADAPIATSTPPIITPATSTPPVGQKVIIVYFPNLVRFNVGAEPYEDPVTRFASTTIDSKQAVLAELFRGPTPTEKALGLFMTYNETTGARLTFDTKTGVAKVYLEGACNSGGATYTIGSIIAKNLRQFPEVKYVRIYAPDGTTAAPETPLSNSSPFCLEP